MARKSKKRQGRSSNADPLARAATTPQDDPKPEICRINLNQPINWDEIGEFEGDVCDLTYVYIWDSGNEAAAAAADDDEDEGDSNTAADGEDEAVHEDAVVEPEAGSGAHTVQQAQRASSVQQAQEASSVQQADAGDEADAGYEADAGDEADAVPFDSVDRLGHHGFVPVLFETPSGFAIFNFDGVQLFLPKAKENIWVNFVKDYMAENYIWLKEFKTFKNKANVLNRTGVKKELDEMIRRWHVPGQLLLVGKEEHKKIIESKLNINCLCDDTVMEVMWGIKHLMKSLVPCEDSELSKDDRLQMTYGMETILKRHGIVVTPEMVNEDIIESACVLYDCELCETKHSDFLTSCGECLEEVSGIDCTGWNPMKLATALKILCIPEDDIACGDPELDFTEEELLKLKTHGSDYDGILRKRTCVAVYREMVSAREILAETVKQLKMLTTESQCP